MEDAYWTILELIVSVIVVGLIGYGFHKTNCENFDIKRRNIRRKYKKGKREA